MMKSILSFLNKSLTTIFVVVILLTVGLLAVFATPNEDGTRTFDGNAPSYTDAQKEALCNVKATIDDAAKALSGIDVPQDATSGCAPTDLAQMGALVYYTVDVSSPTAFYNAVNGRGFNEGYGLQCVAAFKEFMYSLSGKYVAAAGGGAKGYAGQQSQIEPLGFKWHAGTSGLQDGDWAIFGGGAYGHVAMRYQGKWFGQNQGAANANVGNAFNLTGFGTENVIGYYRPNIYQKVAVQPSTPTTPASPSAPSQPSVASSYTVRQGDTLGGISLSQGWWPSASELYGDAGYAQRLATRNSIQNRGVIYPNQVILQAQ